MNIIKCRQQERLQKIGVIQKSIEQAKHPDLEMLKLKCCSEWGISMRTAQDYIKVALFNIESGR